MNPATNYDCFISHASEDKETFVRPLVGALKVLGVKCWYDEDSLVVGDSLSVSIDYGISQSSTGLLIFSKHFIEKPWPKYERRGLVSQHINKGIRLISILHGITHNELQNISPSLSDLVCIDSSKQTIDKMVAKITQAIRPDIVIDDRQKNLMIHIEKIVVERLAIETQYQLQQREKLEQRKNDEIAILRNTINDYEAKRDWEMGHQGWS
jgi:hypothetical protein